jgi:hypothetical protein
MVLGLHTQEVIHFECDVNKESRLFQAGSFRFDVLSFESSRSTGRRLNSISALARQLADRLTSRGVL